MSRARTSSPGWLLVPTTIAVALFTAPLVALLWQVPWLQLGELLTRQETLAAVWLSLRCSFATAVVTVVLGLPLATWLANARGAARNIVHVVVMLPMVLPPTVGGLALLLAFGRRGVLGGAIEGWFGIQVPFSSTAVVLATTYVAMPFFVLSVEAALRSFDRRYAEAAATLGARRWRTFRTVTLPMIAPALGAGLILSWARALGEFGAPITFAGSLQGTTRTLPLAVYHALESQPAEAIALSVLLLTISAAVLFLLRNHWFPAR